MLAPPVTAFGLSLEVVDKLSEAIDKSNISIGVFLDLSKAFDTIKHDILLNKLNHYGIRGTALEWFRSYLRPTGRFYLVTYLKARSDLAPILLGCSTRVHPGSTPISHLYQ